jgi:putative phosphoesterase
MERRFGLISDTHGSVHRSVFEHFSGVEVILHGGDVGTGVLEELTAIAPVHAVCGNTDSGALGLPLAAVVELPFGKAGIAHGHLQAVDLARRFDELHRLFLPNAVRLIVTGHSHIQHLQQRDGVWLVNPGAATRPRFRQQSGLCILHWDEKADTLRFDFRPIDWRS